MFIVVIYGTNPQHVGPFSDRAEAEAWCRSLAVPLDPDEDYSVELLYGSFEFSETLVA